MSYQRAYVNCERCYILASGHRQNEVVSAHDNRIYIARNEAMKALEDARFLFSRGEEALTACLNCDYLKPNIADIVREFLKEGRVQK